MPLSLGSRLGHYEILSVVGAGGMGKVYRARDLQLNRETAIKVLLPAVANDPDRLARLTREAQVLASLNHTNIAAIYGLEDGEGVRALAMEFVEGPTLADRIRQGRVPVDEALPIARQIAEALCAAHERGVIHRDLKPANIKIRPDGTVKVLDFGLAKALDPPPALSADAATSPTLSWHATQAGVILGTAAYMSPEQAAGRSVDRRSDLWTFGVVLLEMLTGKPAFPGETVSHVLAAVLKSEPDWSALPSDTPVAIRRLLRRCLEKDRRRRLADAGDARLEIDDAISPPAGETEAPAPDPLWQRRLPWGIAATLAAAFVFLLFLWSPWREAAPPPSVRLEASVGADARVSNSTFGPAAALSPRGDTLVFVAEPHAGGRLLYLRRLEELTASSIADTAGADSPFFSPDGEWVAFFADGKLKKVAVTGGAAVTLCDAPNGRGGDWGDDGSIVFQPSTTGALMRVSSAGGSPTPLTTLAPGEVTQRWPQILPGGTAVLYTSNSSRTNWQEADIVIQPVKGSALDIPQSPWLVDSISLARSARRGPPDGGPSSGPPAKIVHRGAYYGRYLPNGQLLYVQDGLLFATTFDLAQLSVSGPPTPVLENAVAATGSGAAHVAVSRNGTLAYIPRRVLSSSVPMVWMDQEGKTTPLRATPADWRSPQFSPDGARVAVDIHDGKQLDVWVGDWTRGDGSVSPDIGPRG